MTVVRSAVKRTAAALFESAVTLRSRAYDSRLLPVIRVKDISVVSVGNLTLGGTGKTPFVIYLAKRLSEMGKRTAVISRGYKGRLESKGGMISSGTGPLTDASQSGDEAYLIASATRDVPVYVGADRLQSLLAARKQGAEVAILDDGFSHRRLYRDLDILLTAPEDLSAAAAFFPVGRLREPAKAAARAHLVGGFELEGRGGTPDFSFAHVPVGLRWVDGTPRPLGIGPRKVHLLSGIAKPERFFQTAKNAGFECVGVSVFRDHHNFSKKELRQVFAEASVNHAEAVLTTEKDLVRMPEKRTPMPLLGLCIETQIVSGKERIDTALNGLFHPPTYG